MNEFDIAARHEVKAARSATGRWLFPTLSPTLAFARWLDSQSAPRPGEPDRRCDTIAEFIDTEGTGPPWACVIELFTTADADALDRALEYVGRFRRELRHGPHGHDRYPFAVALVFLTGAPARTRLDMNLPGMEEVGLWFGPRVIDLSVQDAVVHLEAIEQNRLSRSLLAWSALMKGGQSLEFVVRWRVQAELEANELRRRTMVDTALIFSELTDGVTIWKQGLEGLVLKKSAYVQEARDEERADAKREDTLEVLKTRFPGDLPADIVQRIEAEQDIPTLSRWFKLALTVPSLDAFETSLG